MISGRLFTTPIDSHRKLASAISYCGILAAALIGIGTGEGSERAGQASAEPADAGGGISQVGGDTTWPPTEVAWPPIDDSDAGGGDGSLPESQPTAPLPTPIVMPGAPPIAPAVQPRRPPDGNRRGRPQSRRPAGKAAL